MADHLLDVDFHCTWGDCVSGGNQGADRNDAVGVDLEMDHHPHEAYVAADSPGWGGGTGQALVHGVGELEGQSSDVEVDQSHYLEVGNGWAETVGLRHAS